MLCILYIMISDYYEAYTKYSFVANAHIATGL